MSNKKIKIIIFVIIILSLLFIVFLAFNYKNIENKKINEEQVIEKNYLTTEDDYNEDIYKALQKLKDNHPEFSSSQIEFYLNAALKKTGYISPCKRRSDQNNCISSVAFLKGRSDICGEIRDSKIIIKCANETLQRVATEKIEECEYLTGIDYMNCLNNIFVIYNNIEDCSNLTPKNIQQYCEDIVYNKTALTEQNIEICKKINNEKLNQYCFKNIINKFQDTDNDGLSDYEEIFTYKTDPNNSDSDNDGYLDGDEVKNGYNPLGEGKLKQ